MGRYGDFRFLANVGTSTKVVRGSNEETLKWPEGQWNNLRYCHICLERDVNSLKFIFNCYCHLPLCLWMSVCVCARVPACMYACVAVCLSMWWFCITLSIHGSINTECIFVFWLLWLMLPWIQRTTVFDKCWFHFLWVSPVPKEGYRVLWCSGFIVSKGRLPSPCAMCLREPSSRESVPCSGSVWGSRLSSTAEKRLGFSALAVQRQLGTQSLLPVLTQRSL